MHSEPELSLVDLHTATAGEDIEEQFEITHQRQLPLARISEDALR